MIAMNDKTIINIGAFQNWQKKEVLNFKMEIPERYGVTVLNKEQANSQDRLVKKASAVENLATAHQIVLPLHSHGV